MTQIHRPVNKNDDISYKQQKQSDKISQNNIN